LATSSTSATLKDSYEHVQVERIGGVGLVRLHRPKALNALCDALFADLLHASRALDADESIGCLVLTGSGTRAFAAGADISEMQNLTFDQAYAGNLFAEWADLARTSKPVLAAVNGYALGGGCELAMQCDLILAGETAVFGQPEINLGVLPGAGGTQRLTRAAGKARSMYYCLTGDTFTAAEAMDMGLVAKIFPADTLVEEAVAVAQKIASKPSLATRMVKEAVTASQDLPLDQGLRLERRFFHSLFGTADQKEGMAAFLEKRKPQFQGK
jgi:enoyl-CoA hydratase/carnithine racemase